MTSAQLEAALPPRMIRPGPAVFAVLAGTLALVVHAIGAGVMVDPGDIVRGTGRALELAAEAFPPNLDRAGPVARRLLETFEMALVGTLMGATVSLPLAVLAARNTTPHPMAYAVVRGLIGLSRTIPDLVWGILFVVLVGLGPAAGVLALAVDAMGFCARFFAEAIEEVEPGLIEGLGATGASQGGILVGAVLPATLPSLIATAMYALENATRSSVVLGVVGAGGIGIELATSMQLLRFDEALTIIIAIFLVVLAVERLSSAVRRRVL